MHKRLLALVLPIILGVLLAVAAPVSAGELERPYTDKSCFTEIPFGSHSFWLQPWRSYLETVPAHRFVDGMGMGLSTHGADPDLLLRMLSEHGVRNGRIEISWGSMNWDGELGGARTYRRLLQACKKYGVRPMILLNAHQGVPCPMRTFKRTVTADASKGATKIELNDADGLVIGRSGLSGLTGYWAAEALVTEIDGNTVTLSKPLPEAIDAGTRVDMATLKYRPFSKPGSEDYRRTIRGWKHYVDTVARFAADVLGTAGQDDLGFDLEVWNELTFGTKFLYVNRYYEGKPYDYDERSIWRNLVEVTADYAESHPDAFRGVKIANGFANTIPWPASSEQPDRVHAISKHPYTGRKNYPEDGRKGTLINALGRKDESGYLPEFDAFFPEYYGTAFQTETMVRDMGPIDNKIGDATHGRYARANNPCPVWMTEFGFVPSQLGIKDAERARAMKAKFAARSYCFFLNKGVEKLQMFTSIMGGGDTGMSMVSRKFAEYAKDNPDYPENPEAYTSPALKVMERISSRMRKGLDRDLDETRSLEVRSISDNHDNYQFKGDGSREHPPLYDRDMFAFLPFQVNDSRFVIPYYVMTVKVLEKLPPENFTLEIGGLKGKEASVSVYDPIKDKEIPVQVKSRGSKSLTVTLRTTDYPRLLVVQE